MSFSLGNTTIGDMYLGNTKIASAYLGTTCVYKMQAPTPPPFDEVTITGQTWMAKNLAIDDGGAGIRVEHITYTLSGETFDWGTQYFYTQEAARRVASSTSAEGWHLPSTGEFSILSNYAGGSQKLKSTTGWQFNNPGGNGTDGYGFTMLPVGQYSDSTASNNRLGQNSCYWTTTNGVNYWATWKNKNFTTGNTDTGTFNPVRLIKDT